MKLLSILSTLALVSSSALSHPHHDGASIEERQSSAIITTGATGNVYPRLEIRQMKNNYPDQYTLLVLAMEQWKLQPQSSDTSYFGISRIHGVPKSSWNGVGPCGSCGGSIGYCPHDSVLFPAWHRTYVALFEQELIAIVKTIANSYSGSAKTTMVNAANVFRMPFWDWAAHPASGLPTLAKIFTDYSVTVNAPSGSRTLVNPLFRYDFTDSSQLYYGPFTTWKRTYRYPNSNGVNAASQTQSGINAFENIRASLQDQVYQLFTTCKDYIHFSNTAAASSSTSCSNSLEGIHNTVHTVLGGTGNSTVSGGHMTYLPLASFDPIFWFHHANVDRLFAMWQTLNPNSYGASQVAPGSTWTVAQGSTQNADSPLQPFHKTSTAYWTTNQVKDWTVFKYTYPEYKDSDGSAASIKNYINKLYGPNASATAGSSKREAEEERHVKEERGIVDNVVNSVTSLTTGNPLAAANGSLFQYVANINAPRYTLNGSYTVFLFDGNPECQEPADWIFEQNLIGTMGIFSMPDMTDHDLIAAGSIPLTRTLQKMVGTGTGLLTDLTEALVVPFLAARLKWRVQGPDGDEVDPGSIEGFSVSVVSSTATNPSSPNQLPSYSPFTQLVNVTKGQSGGLNSTCA